MTTAAVASLIVGLIIGYLGQRSRMCFVGGIRDFILVRDTFLLKGLIAFGLVAWIAFPIAEQLAGNLSTLDASLDTTTLIFTLVGGLGVGYLSVLANGCPFRQHVLAGQGIMSSVTYLAGFYVGAVIFHLVVLPLLLRIS